MDRLPRELVDAVLRQCVALGPKNHVLEMRLTCRAFDRILKPYACKNLQLDFSRLSKSSSRPRPQMDALQTIGYRCKSLYIDLMVVRDELEVEFLKTIFERLDSMTDFCRTLHQRFCLNDATCTEIDYHAAVEAILFNCNNVDRLRLTLPFQLIGRHCTVATMILANTFKALEARPEEDSTPLETLVLENVTDVAVCQLWMNPIDVGIIKRVLESLKHLVLTIRRHESEPQRVGLFGSCLWNLLQNAYPLESLCLWGMDHGVQPLPKTKHTEFWKMQAHEWRVSSLPAPPLDILSNLTCLELKRIDISPDVFLRALENFGRTLQELYLNGVFLKAEQSAAWNRDSKKVLWVGLPNQRPADDCRWMAMTLRSSAPNLRVCRATHLSYDYYCHMDLVADGFDFDFSDPSGLGRSIAQRFVEVVSGIHQPSMSSGDVVEFLPRDSKDDYLIHNLKPRTRALTVTEYDANAYQIAVANTTSGWLDSMDDVFTNSNQHTVSELHYIAETACLGIAEIQDRRNDVFLENAMAREVTENLVSLPGAQEHQQDPT